MSTTRTCLSLLAGLFALAVAPSVAPPGAPAAGPPAGANGSPQGEPADDARVGVATARDRARLLHTVYAATLDSMHHHFFRRDRAVLPARAMEDVFANVDRQAGVQARWIAVNTPAMSVNHEPESAYEKKATAAIAAGESAVEAVEGGYFRRATAIPLGSGCVSCHTRLTATTDKTPRFAGLVIAIPVVGK